MRTSRVSCCWTTAVTRPRGSRRSSAATSGSRAGSEVAADIPPVCRAAGSGRWGGGEPAPRRPAEQQAEGDQGTHQEEQGEGRERALAVGGGQVAEDVEQ